ncbi:gibberellin-regulated protein 9-like [Salvia miltiorrhiza]|uniref:gibberellin-regulated protein 9-like n=1 Tax=Salvia miltiorrhiza TaxID=226208 RepID=UPI0025AD86E7|nr:gibberellin-regulated protein 9-like [Salvia miltiorrhiza]XP_057793534.1 gibberellin-regulated protein 9-like [Salvia miltiorrhiza]
MKLLPILLISLLLIQDFVEAESVNGATDKFLSQAEDAKGDSISHINKYRPPNRDCLKKCKRKCRNKSRRRAECRRACRSCCRKKSKCP